jgi:hypothetical protein
VSVEIDLPNLVREREYRTKQPVYYVRMWVHGRTKRIRLREPYGTPAFLAEYQKAIDALKAAGAVPGRARHVRENVIQRAPLGWLAREYFASTEFKALDPVSQRNRSGVIEGCLAEPIKPGSKVVMRNCPYKRVDAATSKCCATGR